MADHHLRAFGQGSLQQIPTDNPVFLPKIVGRTLQQVLEAEVTEHVEAASRGRTEDRKGIAAATNPES